MKRIIALLLILAMSFSLVACDFEKIADNLIEGIYDAFDSNGKDEDETSVESTDDASSSEETSSEETSSDDESSSEEIPVGPVYEDQTKYYFPEENAQGKFVYREGVAFSKPIFTPYYHNYKAAVSMTFDDGYHEETGYYVSRVFNRYGFTGTAMLSVCFIEDSWTQDQWKQIFSYGYLDAGVHGWNHSDPNSITDEEELNKETIEATNFIKSVFTSQNVLTFATPFARITDEYKAKLEECVISNRLESGGNTISLVGEDLYKVKSISFNRGSSFANIQPSVSQFIQNGKWITILMHGVGDVNNTDVTIEEFDKFCQYLSFQKDVWVASFEKVSIYAKQLESSSFEYVAADSESITLKLTSTLDKEIYNIPMSAKVYIPSFATTAYAVVDGVAQHSYVKSDMYGKYITVLDIPYDEEFVVYIGGNSWCENDCENHVHELVETVESTCTECGYQLYRCATCEHQYKTRYLSPTGHKLDYSTEAVIKAPTEYTTGTSKSHCTSCDKDIEYLTRYTGETE